MVCADAGHTGEEKRPEHEGRAVESVDGPPIFTEQCRRDAPVAWGMSRSEVLAAAKNLE
ncbi:hypothetical protein D3C73_1094690 [compost metagenome]